MMYKSLGGLIFGYGILGGLGVGFAYVTPIATCIKWFPDKTRYDHRARGLRLRRRDARLRPLLSKMIAASGIATTFYTVAAIMLIFVCGAAAIFKVPPAGTSLPAGTLRPRRRAHR